MASFLLASFLTLLAVVQGDEHDSKYERGDEITIWVNKVGPYHNPQETYEYYRLPICKPDPKRVHVHNTIGAILEGSHIQDSGLRIKFREDQSQTQICNLELTERRARMLSGAVRNHYWYQMYIDELPIWGMVGDLVKKTQPSGEVLFQPHVYLHKAFSISYNGDRIIHVNLTSENLKPIMSDQSPEDYAMTYSVKWVETNATFATRFDRYLDFDFFEHQIRFFSIFNSFMMVVFMCGVVALILMRVLKADYARYLDEEDDLELDRVVEESGWKLVHGDVFRPPPFLSAFAALLGTGYQLLTMAMLTMLVVLTGDTYDERGLLLNWLVFFYAVTSLISCYSGASFYKRSDGKHWKWTMVLTAILLPGVVSLISLLLSIIGWTYGSETGLPVSVMFWLFLLWLVVSCPLVVVGTLLGRSLTKGTDKSLYAETRRPIPDSQWYWTPSALIMASGILPFGSIFIEMYFVFAALWNYKFYYVYGFLLLVYTILIIVTICSSIVCVYFLLNGEDYRWHWTSFFSGGATALYVYCYAIYYFISNTQMTGLLQTTYYFAYMGIFCFGLFALCGTVAYTGSSIFVRKIYAQIKSD